VAAPVAASDESEGIETAKARLQALSELLDSGLVSQAEFDEKRAKILDSL